MSDSTMSLAATELMINISAQYPGIYTFLMALTALVGFVGCGYVFLLLVQVKVFQTVSTDQFNWGLAIPAVLISAMMISLPYTLAMSTETLFGKGYGSVLPPSEITKGVTAVAMLGMFAEQTVRILGWLIGFWGLVNIYFSRLPSGDRDQLWSGLIRLALGAVLISARIFGNLFGGMGDRIFG